MESLLGGLECGCQSAVPHEQLSICPFDVFSLQLSLSGKAIQIPGSFSLEQSSALAELCRPREEGKLAEIRDAVITTAQLGMMKVVHAAGEMRFGISGCQRQAADVDVLAAQDEQSVGSPNKRRVALNARVDAAGDYSRLVLAAQQRVVQKNG